MVVYTIYSGIHTFYYLFQLIKVDMSLFTRAFKSSKVDPFTLIL